MRLNMIYMCVMTVGLTACASLNTATLDVETQLADTTVEPVISRIETTCRHLERDLTQGWSERRYWCIPESVTLANSIISPGHSPVVSTARPTLSHETQEIKQVNDVPDSPVLSTAGVETHIKEQSITEHTVDPSAPCIETVPKEYGVPAGFMRKSATAGPYERQKSPSFPAETSFQLDSDTQEKVSNQSGQENIDFDASAFTTVNLNPPIDPLADGTVLPVDVSVDITVSDDSDAAGLASR